jgi:Asparagine synthase (glutamine-hydrolyzing)
MKKRILFFEQVVLSIVFIIIINIMRNMPHSNDIGRLLEDAVSRETKEKDLAVAFSGGLDSGLIAAMARKHAANISLYTAGTLRPKDGTADPGWSYDARMAKSMASELDLEWNHITIDEEGLEKTIEEMMRITGTTDLLTLSFELPLFYVCANCKEDNVMTGQGADEIFAGYSKYVGLEAESLRKMMKDDLHKLKETTLIHEKKVAEHFGKKIVYPFLDEEVMALAESMSIYELMPTETTARKAVLRSVATDMGYHSIASKEKKAAQYGSGVMDAIRRLSKNKGLTCNELIASIAERTEVEGK